MSNTFDEAFERQKKDPKARRAIHEARVLEPLHEDVAWQHLRQKVEASKESFLIRIAERQMRGEEVSQREIDFLRGYYHGALDLLMAPERAEQNLEREAKRAYRKALAEANEAQAKEEESPYA